MIKFLNGYMWSMAVLNVLSFVVVSCRSDEDMNLDKFTPISRRIVGLLDGMFALAVIVRFLL